MRPSAVTSSAVTPVVPASMLRTVTATPLSRGLEPELVEDERVDAAGHHALLVVLHAGPVGQGGVETVGGVRAGVPEAGEARPHVGGEVAVEWDRGGRVGLAEEDVVQVQQPDQLGDGALVVVDAQVDEYVAAAAVPTVGGDHQQCRALASATVAAR